MSAPALLGALFLLFLSISLPNFVPVSARAKSPPTGPFPVSSRGATPKVIAGRDGGSNFQQQHGIFVDSFLIHSDIQFRYSRTKVMYIVVNRSQYSSRQVQFNVTIPDTAFISKFTMSIGNETFEADVAKREEETFSLSDMGLKSAGLVEKRNANVFTITAKVAPKKTGVFTLLYEELLERHNGLYEHVIHIDPDMARFASDYRVTVSVADSRNLTLLRAIAGIRNKDPIQNEIQGAKVKLNGKIGDITWTADPKKKAIPKRFILQYDIDHHPEAGQILIRDGHFIHFFSPKSPPVLPKHVIFVLHISDSMQGARLRHLKAVMNVTLKDLYDKHKKDYFSIITSHNNVTVWNGPAFPQVAQNRTSFRVTNRTILAACSFIKNMQPNDLNNTHAALITALNVAAAGTSASYKNVDPIIMFLTDGNPTEGVTNKEEILSRIAVANGDQQVPIFSIALGQDLDFPFLRTLSHQSGATARIIHDSSDAVLELESLYGAISSPALSKVSFQYTSDQITDLTRSKFSRFFKGSEIIVAGKVKGKIEDMNDACKFGCVHGNLVPLGKVISGSNSTVPTGVFGVVVAGNPVNVTKTLKSADIDLCSHGSTSHSDVYDVEDLFDECGKDGFMERLWAFLTIKQLIEHVEAGNSCPPSSGAETPAKRALALALKYGFVTPLTSLVLTRTDRTKEVIPFPYKGHTKLLSDLNRPDHQLQVLCVSRESNNVTAQTEPGISNPLGPNATQASTAAASSTTTTTVGPSVLTLNDISWLSSDGNNWIQINDENEAYFASTDDYEEELPDEGVLCDSRTCTHLRDCILPEFINDFEIYMEDYFCHMRTSEETYAGACCPPVSQPNGRI